MFSKIQQIPYINESKEFQIEKSCKEMSDIQLTETEAKPLRTLADSKLVQILVTKLVM